MHGSPALLSTDPKADPLDFEAASENVPDSSFSGRKTT
jgi:hypothetical protein